MTAAERGVLLLCAQLPGGEKPLSMAQFRTLSQRAHARGPGGSNPMRELREADLLRLGYDEEAAGQILRLFSREALLDQYLADAAKRGVTALTRISPGYPARLAEQLGPDCPPVLFARGDLRLLRARMIGVVGSRALHPANRAFAETAGRQIADEGYTLVSGGAAGADTAAQEACLAAGGSAVIFPAGSLLDGNLPEHTCYVSAGGFDLAFSVPHAMSRNRYIHAMAGKVLVAQTGHNTGGTWAGSADNLRRGYSPVFVYDDGSEGAQALAGLGAEPVTALGPISALQPAQLHF